MKGMARSIGSEMSEMKDVVKNKAESVGEDESLESQSGTMGYMAPEVACRYMKHGKKADLWSIGYSNCIPDLK